MKKIIILGIGNRLMMDDGIGIYVVEELGKHNVKSNVQYVVGESDVDHCINQIEKANFVIILDAVISGNHPGEISIYSLSDLHTYQTLDLSLHNIHLFQMLYQQKDTIHGFLIGIEPYEINFHIGLSKRLEEKWHSILENVLMNVEELLENKGK